MYDKEEVEKLCRSAFQNGMKFREEEIDAAEYSHLNIDALNEDKWIEQNL